jgi:U3 small nucleolar ribonucleoprotein protein LCP5
LGALQDIEEQENERYRNVLNRKKQKSEIYEGGSNNNKRSREDNEDNEDNFNGLFDGERKSKNKFSQKRNKKSKSRR